MDTTTNKAKIEIKSRRGAVLATTEEYDILTAWGRSGNLSAANLRWANLREADLAGAELYGADLREANLREANLAEADLREADLREAELAEADLAGANLRGANLAGADLAGADLREADLAGANLRGANLRDANLRDANLRGANLRDANLRDANLSAANLSAADLRDADLRDANLSAAKGLLDPVEWLKANFDSDAEGVIVYKRIGDTSYSPPAHWTVEPGAYLTEVVNPTRTVECACGVNFGTRAWCEDEYPSATLWRCRIEWWDLAGVVVPYYTDGKARCARLKLLEIVTE